MTKKVVYVTMQFPVPSEVFAAVEIRALRRLGADVTVLTYRIPSRRDHKTLAELGLSDLAVLQGRPVGSLKRLIQCLRKPTDSLYLTYMTIRHCWREPLHLVKSLMLIPRSLALLQDVKRLEPAVVHLFWGHYPSLLGLLVKRSSPGVVISHFLGAYDLERRFPLSAVLARQADLLLTHARANLPALGALGVPAKEAQVSYRGIDITCSAENPDKSPGLIVAAERLVRSKHTADVLRVFARLAQAVPTARLRVLGDGPESGPLRELARALAIEEKVRFLGHVSHSEVLRQFSKAEVAITMSQSPSERLPNAIKEAMLQSCICLSTRTIGIEELITDGETGLIVECGDVETAAKRLIALLGDPPAKARLSEQARAKIVRDFNVDHLMAERLQAWLRVFQNKLRQTAS